MFDCFWLSVPVQLIAWKDSSPNDLLCVEWDVKPYTLTHLLTRSAFCRIKCTHTVQVQCTCRSNGRNLNISLHFSRCFYMYTIPTLYVYTWFVQPLYTAFLVINACALLHVNSRLDYATVLYYRRRVVRHTAHIAVYQSLSVRAVATRYTPSTADITDTSSLKSVAIALEVENVNTVSSVLLETYLYLVGHKML